MTTPALKPVRSWEEFARPAGVVRSWEELAATEKLATQDRPWSPPNDWTDRESMAPARMTLTRGGQPVLHPGVPYTQPPRASMIATLKSLPERFQASVMGTMAGLEGLRGFSALPAETQEALRQIEIDAPGSPAAAKVAKMREIDEKTRLVRQEAARQRAAATPAHESEFQQAIGAVAESALPTAVGVATGLLTRNPALGTAIGVTGAAAQQYPASYWEVMDKTGDHRLASNVAVIDTLAEMGGEKVGLDAILRRGGRGAVEALKRILRAAGVEAAEEAITETVQLINAKLQHEPELTLPEAMHRVRVAMMAGGLGGTAFGGIATAGDALANRMQMGRIAREIESANPDLGDAEAAAVKALAPPKGTPRERPHYQIPMVKTWEEMTNLGVLVPLPGEPMKVTPTEPPQAEPLQPIEGVPQEVPVEQERTELPRIDKTLVDQILTQREQDETLQRDVARALAREEFESLDAAKPQVQQQSEQRIEQGEVGRDESEVFEVGPDAVPGGRRPDAGPSEQAAFRNAVGDIRSWNLRSPGAVLAREIVRDFRTRGASSLEGKTIASAEDLARLAQVYRSATFETFRYFLADKSGKVIAQLGITSRLPSSTATAFGDLKDFTAKLRERIKATGASQVWLLHNHPSGTAVASPGDVLATKRLMDEVPEVAGHVIIDHNKYAFIARHPTGVMVKDNLPIQISERDPLRAGVLPRYVIGSPGHLATLASRLARPDAPVVTFIGTDNSRATVAIGEVPVERLSTPASRKWTARRWALHTGSRFIYAVGGPQTTKVLRALAQESLAFDSVVVREWEGGERSTESMAETGQAFPGGEALYGKRRARPTPDTSQVFAELGRRALEARTVHEPETPYEMSPAKQAMERFLKGAPTEPQKGRPTHVNYGTINSVEDVKKAIALTSEAYEDEIQAQRRGTVSWKQTYDEAARQYGDTVGLSPEEIEKRMGRKPGTPAGAAELAARREILTRETERLVAMIEPVAEGRATDEQAAEFLAQTERVALVLSYYLGARAEVGRALNILRNMDRLGLSPEAAKRSPRKTRDRLNELQRVLDTYKGKEKVTELAQALREVARERPNQPGAIAAAARLAAQPSIWDAAVEVWKAGLLWMPWTHQVNLVGTLSFIAMRVPETQIATLLSVALPGRTQSQVEAAAMAAASTLGLIKALKAAFHTFMRGGLPEKVEMRQEAFKGSTFGLSGRAGKAVDVTGEVLRGSYRLLGAEDAFARVLAEEMTRYQLAVREAVQSGKRPWQKGFWEAVTTHAMNPSPAAIEQIQHDSDRFSFNKELGEKGRLFQALVHRVHAEPAFPFIRTPGNIFKEAFRRTPLAPLVGEWREDIAAGGARRNQAIAEVLFSTSLASLWALLAGAGVATGGGDPERGKKAVDRAAGKQPYSINVDAFRRLLAGEPTEPRPGDRYIEYKRIEPLGTPLMLAADGVEFRKYMSQEDRDKWARMVGFAFAQNITNKTMLKGMTDLVNVLSDPERYGEQYFEGLAGSLIPGFVSLPAVLSDPVMREVTGTKEAIQARLPRTPLNPEFHREALPPRYDVFGKPIPSMERWGGFAPISRWTDDPVRSEAARLGVSITLPLKRVDDVKLPPELYAKYAEMVGTVAHEVLSEIVASPGYQNLADPQRKELFRRVFAKVRSAVRSEIKTQPELGGLEGAVERELKRSLGN